MATDKLSMPMAKAVELMLATEEAYPVVEVTLKPAQGGGTRLNCYHRRLQRTLVAGSPNELDSILVSWGLKEAPELPPERRVRYLVDGMVMSFVREGKQGYWVARCTKEGKVYRKYFGKVDPRDRYPVA